MAGFTRVIIGAIAEQADAPNLAIARPLQFERQWRRVGDPASLGQRRLRPRPLPL